MKIVVEIPNSLYANLQKIQNGSIASSRILNAVKNGKPLPKGHGSLKDEYTIIKALQEKAERPSIKKNLDTVNGLCGAVNVVLDAPTVIEADREVENE